jgi:hypothetical protein
MKNSNNLLWISLCVLVLSGCATKKEIISLPTTVQTQISSTDVYIEECKKKVSADIEKSHITTYTGGGLAFALVDAAIESHREESAEDALVDVQKEVQTFNFQEKYQNRLTQILQSTHWLQVQRVNYLAGLNDAAYEEIINKANTDAVLTSKFIYKLNPQFNVLTGTLYLTLYPTSNKTKKMVNAENPLEMPIFKVHVSATEQLSQASESIEENAKFWAQNNGFHLRKGLENILNQFFFKLDQVLRNPNHLPGE